MISKLIKNKYVRVTGIFVGGVTIMMIAGFGGDLPWYVSLPIATILWGLMMTSSILVAQMGKK